MSKKYLGICLLCFIFLILMASSATNGTELVTNESTVVEHTGKGHKHTISHYKNEIKKCFDEDRWEAGKYMLDEAKAYYNGIEPFYELTGWYYFHLKDYNNARFYLTKCLRNDNTNTHARELLVDVEDFTKHYSGALCYINEILENNPYSKKWWIRKIDIYKKLKNTTEADRCLERLHQIYPDDDDFKEQLSAKYVSDYKKAQADGNILSAIETSSKLVKLNPTSTNYIYLVNTLYSSGRITEACSYAKEGYNKTHNGTLLNKYIGMLCEQGKHYEALSYLTSIGDKSSALRKGVEEDMASYANMHDPYMAYARLYEKTHSKESFDYIVNVGLIKGYYDAVIDYITDWQKRGGKSVDVLYKKYTAYQRIGNDNKALETLEDVYVINHNKDIANELSGLYYNKARDLVSDEEYEQAIPYLTFINNNCTEKDVSIPASKKLAACYYNLKRYDEYIASLDPTDSLYNDKYAIALSLQGKYDEALSLVKGQTYTDIAIPYIKSLMDSLNYEKSLNIIDTALTYTNQKELYMYAISCSKQLNKDASTYINKGYKLYPLDDYFINQYVGELKDNTLGYIKSKEYNKAFESIDSALTIKDKDKELLYTKGLIYEKTHQYDSAFVYQKYYNPDVSETYLYKAKLNTLFMRSTRNNISIDYHQARLGQLDIITSNASIEYEHILKNKNSWALGLGYIGRDDPSDEDEYITEQTPGGIGLLFSGRYTHNFKHDWIGTVSAAFGTKYFPRLNLKVAASKTLNKEWTISGYLQYRSIDSYKKIGKEIYDELGSISYVFDHWDHQHQNMFTLGASVNKPINDFDFNFGAAGFLIKNKPYFSINTKIQYMPIEGSKTSIYLTGGCGTAPEISLIDYAMPKSFEKLNANVGIGGLYVLTKNLSIGLEGTWHTMYKQTEILGKETTYRTSYVNLFYIHPQLFITF